MPGKPRCPLVSIHPSAASPAPGGAGATRAQQRCREHSSHRNQCQESSHLTGSAVGTFLLCPAQRSSSQPGGCPCRRLGPAGPAEPRRVLPDKGTTFPGELPRRPTQGWEAHEQTLSGSSFPQKWNCAIKRRTSTPV